MQDDEAADSVMAVMALVFWELAQSAEDYLVGVRTETDAALGRIEEELRA